MQKINLEAETKEQQILKEYLENNVSEMLAEKINNGVRIEKDGKTLVNKKNLETFLNYACEEARKQADTGARSACIDHETVFGWAIHYFEEDSLEGTLLNEDGTEYTPPRPIKSTKATATKPVTAPKPKQQLSFFDLAKEEPEDDEKIFENIEGPENEEPVEEVEAETLADEPAPKTASADDDELTKIGEMKYIDKYGEIHFIVPDTLKEIFGNLLIVGVDA